MNSSKLQMLLKTASVIFSGYVVVIILFEMLLSR